MCVAGTFSIWQFKNEKKRGEKKWRQIEQPFFRPPTHRVKTQQVVKSRGQRRGDIELAGYLANAAGPVPLVLDLRITHDRIGSNSDPTLNGRLHYNDIDKSLNETGNDKIRKYHSDYNNNPPNSVALSRLFLVRMDVYIVTLSDFYSYRLIGKLTVFLQVQEFSQCSLIVGFSTSVAWRSRRCLSQNAEVFSERLQFRVLPLT